VLDHDPGAKVAFGGERQMAARPRGGSLPICPEQCLKRGRLLRDRLAQIEGCRPEPRLRGAFSTSLTDV
jgi:hypothetical protein